MPFLRIRYTSTETEADQICNLDPLSKIREGEAITLSGNQSRPLKSVLVQKSPTAFGLIRLKPCDWILFKQLRSRMHEFQP